MLFFELACIRWFGATVVLLTFFTNVLLIACFLGTSIGYLCACGKKDYSGTVIPFTLLAVFLACALYLANSELKNITVSVGRAAAPQIIYFGSESRFPDPAQWVIPIWLIGGVFFTLVSLIFVGIGQWLGRAFDEVSNRIHAYTANLLGSIAGIGGFFVMSYLSAPAYLWFLVSMLLCLYFLKKKTLAQIMASAFVVLLIAFGTDIGQKGLKSEIWSPYYKVVYTPRNGSIDVNGIGHQKMTPVRQAGSAYSLPYYLLRDSGQKPAEDILIIGAGSGNDVAAALWHTNPSAHIDAVEIDPKILAIGKAYHPDQPYSDARVTTYLDDGRSFLKKNTGKKYDLIIYALVDSLALHSGYSSIRLESYLFTKEAFADVRARLKPDGLFVMYNYYRQGWVIGRLNELAHEVFGTQPLVFSLPFQPQITMDQQTDAFTMILAGPGRDNRRLLTLYKAFLEKNYFWLSPNPYLNERTGGFNQGPPDELADLKNWSPIRPARIIAPKNLLTPADNWPFLYLNNREIPLRPTAEGILLMGILSAALLFMFAKSELSSLNGRMFFLGAGFMLLETKSVVHMALLFGSTWMVNSIVFTAILVMTLLANLFVLSLKPKNLNIYYGLLIASLLLNALVPIAYFLSLPAPLVTPVSCAVVFLPIFFAGIVFTSTFRDSEKPGRDMGSNIAGVILGGLSENLSLVLGFNHLLFVAALFYALSFLLKPKLKL